MQCFFFKLVQMSNFDRLNSANEHILDRLFPNLRQIPKINLTDMVGIIKKLHSPKKYLLSNAVLFLQIGANVQFWSVKISKWALLDRLFPNLRQIPKIPLTDMVGII